MSRQKYRTKKKRGVPKGYKHDWDYDGRWRETKVSPGNWNVGYTATKSRRVKAKYHKGAPPLGTLILWKINGYQMARKVGRNVYRTHLRARKKLIRIQRPFKRVYRRF